MQNFSYLESLNPAQRAAVETLDGPLLVLAGAGTGKTKVLTTRLAHLLATGKAYPSEVLAVTFTNKAAAEMKRRVSLLLGQEVDGLWIGTFHSTAARMLRRHAELVGLKSNFTILDEDDQLRLIKVLLEAANIDVKKCPPRTALGLIQKWKDRALLPDALTVADAGDAMNGKALDIYRLYQARLGTLNACDFGDLLMHIITIFRKHPDVLASYQRRFKYILVDEYQDTNAGQYMWLKMLADQHKNICCVGDDDQSIYGWRGAEVANILRFEKDFPAAQIVRLEQNYRSYNHILSAANGVIAHNKERLGKNLWSAAGDGEKIVVRGVWDGMQEAQAAVSIVEDLRRKGIKYSEMAVLVRASHQTRLFEEKFMREKIPHKVMAGMRFYERQEIRDAIAYLRAIYQPADDLAFERIINVPKRGIGAATVDKLRATGREKGLSLQDVLAESNVSGKAGETLAKFMQALARWRTADVSHVELARMVLEESGYIDMWKADKTPEAAGRVENLHEFLSALGEFESLAAFLEHVSLVMDADAKSDGDQLSVMTYHAAKGLEFDAVILPGWEEGLFPSQRAMDETGEAGLEEERRLAYVGITRARKRAFILFAANRLTYGNWMSSLPSRFIDELPKDHVEVQGEVGTYKPQNAFRAPQPVFADDLESEGGLNVGDRVSHDIFGFGTVLGTEGNKVEVNFDRAGRKKLMESFVRKAAN